jgi:hypothetical protein
MEILGSTDFVDYYFAFRCLWTCPEWLNVDIVDFICNGKTEQHDLAMGMPKGMNIDRLSGHIHFHQG